MIMSGEARMNNTATSEAPQLKVQDVITLTARLAQLLAEEVDLLSEMKVSKIEALQQEKIFITNALEAQRKLLDRHPGFSESIPSKDKSDLQDVVNVFQDILEENHRKLLLAKEVNHKIVQAITEVVKENTQARSYNGSGVTGGNYYTTMSVTLDKTV
jgi:hypothetical protein